MSENVDISSLHQIELTFRGIESVRTLRSVSARLFSKIGSEDYVSSDLSELIIADAALTAKILSVAHEQGIIVSEEDFTLEGVVGQLNSVELCEGLFSVEFFSEVGNETDVILPQQELARHNIAVACCAKIIAEKSNLQVNPALAYGAGLLHDIGKLAIEKAMPKSFARLVEGAKRDGVCICDVERKYLGVDHAVIGKRLAEMWHFPESIALGIWLHHSDTAAIGKEIKKAVIASIVRLADCVARNRGIGDSGSYDECELPIAVMESVGIEQGQIEEIGEELDAQVSDKCKVLGVDSAGAKEDYCDVFGKAAGRLAKERVGLLEEKRQLQSKASHFVFVTEFISSIDSNDEPIDIAKKLAVSWQRFYQTGSVCVYLKSSEDERTFDAAVVENTSEVKSVAIEGPADEDRAVDEFGENGVVDAGYSMGWLLEQVGVEFDLNIAKFVGLYCRGKRVGGVLFELWYPVDMELLAENINSAAKAVGALVGVVLTCGRSKRLSEQFVGLIGGQEAGGEEKVKTEETKESKETKDDLLAALAEMAAGAAHELNNPLSVISGRSQLLAQGESDEEKKKILQQIRENTSELASIIDGLMGFAKPAAAKMVLTSLNQIVDEASELAALKSKVEKVDVQLRIADGVEKVVVDSGQVVSAIANIFVNSLEAYPEKKGVIEVSAERAGGLVKLSITDFGCGMDSETVNKATHPFFSVKQSGRQRGMGLAYANRVIQLNGGKLEIASEADKGTTVTIYLPCE